MNVKTAKVTYGRDCDETNGEIQIIEPTNIANNIEKQVQLIH